MKIWAFLFVIFVFGCGKKYSRFHIDDELVPYAEDFVVAGKLRGNPVELKNIIIKLGNANDIKPQVNKIGYCLFQRDSEELSFFEDTEETNIVVVDRTFFNRTDISDYTRRELIFHELGHCVLNRNHDQRVLNGQPESIMYPNSVSMRSVAFYSLHEKSYIDELFKFKDSAFPNGSPSQLVDKIEEISSPILFISTEDGCIKTE